MLKVRRKPKPKSTLGDLPPEIILYIVDLLLPDSKVCLALTCHSLANLLYSSFKDPSLHFKRHSVYSTGRFKHNLQDGHRHPARQRLLRTLEDNRRLYCSNCLKLQPVPAFSLVNRLIPRKYRSCKLGHIPTLIHISPGLMLSFQDRQALTARLRDARMPSIANWWMSTLVLTPPEPNPSPSPSPKTEPKTEPSKVLHDFTVSVSVTPMLLDNNQLLISVDYLYRKPEKGVVDDWLSAMIPICPHTRLALVQFSGKACETPVISTCADCNTTWTIWRDNIRRYSVRVDIYLGNNDQRPDRVWERHTDKVFYKSLGRAI